MSNMYSQRPPSSSRPRLASRTGRPNSGRLRTGYGVPSTGRPSSSFGMPGTAGRPISSRRTTSYGAEAGQGIGLNTEVQVTARPVQKEGMMGLKARKEGPGRQVLDKSYFMGELRTRMTQLSEEINKLRKEYDRIQRESSHAVQMEKKGRLLKKEVKTLKETLLELNIAHEKVKSGISNDELEEECLALKAENDSQRQLVDKIFSDRNKKDKMIKELQSKIHQKESEFEEELNSKPEQRALFYQLKQEKEQLAAEQNIKQQELSKLKSEYDTLSEQMDDDKRKHLSMLQQREKMRNQKEKLQHYLDNPDEATGKVSIMEQVKIDKEELEKLKHKISLVMEEVERLKSETRTLDENLDEYTGEKSQKYEKLLKKDQEMQEFIDSFDESKSDLSSKVIKTETNILKYLERMSRALANEEELPSVDKYAELKDDLEFKEKQAEFSKTTLERLESEVKNRQADLEKMHNIDRKLSQDMENMNEKVARMENENRNYERIDQLKADHEVLKQKMEERSNYLKTLISRAKQRIRELSSRTEKIKKELSSDENHLQLENLENKISRYEQNVFSMNQFVMLKGAETDFSELKHSAIDLIAELNKINVKSQTSVSL